MSRRVVDAVPSIEVIRFVSSGTEATMSALRLARAKTGEIRSSSLGVDIMGMKMHCLLREVWISESGDCIFIGVHPGYAASTLVSEYNDLESVKSLWSQILEKLQP
ncbi:MAG: hypothetical protein Ct9H300mP19_12490 [Dehalococcoidia bacterium]|nr:MAG: hypothetical protein Ct9H300mP19_12490 [Dehalococcoidia bacterium]